jgi:hypothetical protein
MAKILIKSVKKNNSHPAIKLAIRQFIIDRIKPQSILDIYGGNGLMFNKIWRKQNVPYRTAGGDAIKWLNEFEIYDNIIDIDPYGSPFEALEILLNKHTMERIGVVCTDGYLRRACMMKTKFTDIFRRLGFPERNSNLMSAIYYHYPQHLRNIIMKLGNNKWVIDSLVVKYGTGTWKQATCYFGCILKRVDNKLDIIT